MPHNVFIILNNLQYHKVLCCVWHDHHKCILRNMMCYDSCMHTKYSYNAYYALITAMFVLIYAMQSQLYNYINSIQIFMQISIICAYYWLDIYSKNEQWSKYNNIACIASATTLYHNKHCKIHNLSQCSSSGGSDIT